MQQILQIQEKPSNTLFFRNGKSHTESYFIEMILNLVQEQLTFNTDTWFYRKN